MVRSGLWTWGPFRGVKPNIFQAYVKDNMGPGEPPWSVNTTLHFVLQTSVKIMLFFGVCWGGGGGGGSLCMSLYASKLL